mgnify:CR=1 FL=1
MYVIYYDCLLLGVEDIARAIASGKTKLTTINFSKNAISSEGVIALAAAMKVPYFFACYAIWVNPSLCAALPCLQTLNRPMSVDLSDNKLIGLSFLLLRTLRVSVALIVGTAALQVEKASRPCWR